MGLKPDILEKGETLIDNINAKLLPEVQPAAKNFKEVSARLNDLILPEAQKTLETVNETLSKIKKLLSLAVACLCVIALAAVGTMAGVVVLLVR